MIKVVVHYTDGKIGTYENAYIYSHQHRVLVIKQNNGITHVIPHKAYSLASETKETS